MTIGGGTIVVMEPNEFFNLVYEGGIWGPLHMSMESVNPKELEERLNSEIVEPDSIKIIAVDEMEDRLYQKDITGIIISKNIALDDLKRAGIVIDDESSITYIEVSEQSICTMDIRHIVLASFSSVPKFILVNTEE